MLWSTALVVFAFLAPGSGTADPHVHGEGALSISSDDTNLIVEFVTDQHTLFGFEGEPKTEQQREHQAAVSAKVVLPGALLRLETSRPCLSSGVQLSEQSAEDLLGLEGQADHHHEDDHSDEHHDVLVRETFMCEASPAITSVQILAFESFASLESVRVTVLTDSQQEEHLVRKTQPMLRFR